MAPEILRFESETQPLTGVSTQTVYWKDRWNGPWIAAPQLWCTERTWTMAPSLSTAAIRFRYGERLPPGAIHFEDVFPLDGRLRWYVRIDDSTRPINAADDSASLRSWYGVIDETLNELLGPALAAGNDGATALPRGRQHFLAYGLEAILAVSWVVRSFLWADPAGEQIVQRALAFNPGLADDFGDAANTTRQGNRSAARSQALSYLFHDGRTGGGTWSTRDVCEYLLAYATARNHADERTVPFFLDDADSALRSDDAPILAAEGRSVFELLNMLIGRQRGLAWRCEVRTAADGQTDQVAVVPCTFLADDLFLGNQQIVRRNPHQKILSFERDRGAEAVVTLSSTEAVDQVLVRGERRTSTATFSFLDGTLAAGWPAALETAYEEGASTGAEYPAAGEVEDRQYWNAAARSSDRFRSVYSRFVLSEDFAGFVGDGLNGPAHNPLMPSDADPDSPEPLAPDDQRFLPMLSLLEGCDYSGDAIDGGNLSELGDKPYKHQQPLVLAPRKNLDPGDGARRYQQLDAAGLAAYAAAAGAEGGNLYSANVRVDDRDGALWIELANGFQWLLAKADFTPLDDDVSLDDVPFDFRQLLCTLSVPWSQFAEARYPPQVPAGGADVTRVMLVEAPHRRVDYVAPETVVGLDVQTLLPLRTDVGGFIRDDRDQLSDIAHLAFTWYGVNRQAVHFATHLINNRVELGDLIVALGDPDLPGDVQITDVNSVVTMIRIHSPLAEGSGDARPRAPRIDYQTAFGELDVLQLVPRMRQR